MPTKVLVVEDETITAIVIAEYLQQLGYTVIDTVNSGTGAIASASQNRPDLVLMDINLKRNDLDGITTATQIREQFKIPVIYLTAYSDDTTLERAKITEPFGYIIKPFNERDLRVAIENALYKHQIEQQLVEQNKLLSTILHSTADGVVATNETGAITYMNPTAEAMIGWSLMEAKGQNITDVIRFVDKKKGKSAENPAIKVFQEGKIIYLDDYMALVAKDGTKTPVRDKTSPIFKDTDTPTSVILILGDTSECRQAEQLEAEVAQSQQVKAQAQQLLAAEQELDELKSRLISTISHEYRTPLTVIQTSAEILRNYGTRFSEEKKATHLNRIQAAVQRMTQLVNDVLTFAEAEASILPYNPAPWDVEAFCHKLIEEQQSIVGERCILNFMTKNTCGTANLDAKLLHSILSNLLTNAIKYSSTGNTVSLSSWRENKHIIFQVQDQGIGIPLAEQERLFSPFFRASNVGLVQGTGMGLSIVKKCVDLHGGQISIESEVGVGTTVTVALPLQNSSSSPVSPTL
jgi:PAS domain S-box-containing protein